MYYYSNVKIEIKIKKNDMKKKFGKNSKGLLSHQAHTKYTRCHKI